MSERIDPAVIAAAERVVGVVYTDAERALMADNLATQVALALRRRAVPLPEDLPPAHVFDPRLPGFAMPAPPRHDIPLGEAELPQDEASIAHAPVTELAGWIFRRALTSERLTRIYLARAERHNARLNCFALLCPEPALARARALDRLLADGTWFGPLHGIPYGCKDILDTAGLETAWGAEPYRGRVPSRDAAVVERLHAAGAVLLGKTSVGALAYGDLWYGGRTRNPWNPEEGSSGSSAGSGSAVAAGLCGFALGTETLGSIVSPSTRCGVVGLRPTHGRVPRRGAMPLCWSLDKIGPMTRSVADAALVLAALNGAEPDDPCGIDAPFGADLAAGPHPLRIGYYEADFSAPGAGAGERDALERLRDWGHALVPLERPDLPYDALAQILAAEAAASFESLTESGADDRLAWQEPAAWPNAFRKARFLSAVDHVQLDRLRRRTMQVMDEAFAGVDLIAGPSLAGPMLVITNFTGHPCLCLPAGLRPTPTRTPLTTLARLAGVQDVAPGSGPEVPYALCLWAPLFREDRLLEAGHAVFQASRRRPPDL